MKTRLEKFSQQWTSMEMASLIIQNSLQAALRVMSTSKRTISNLLLSTLIE
jgi:hypothetical protein